MSAANDDDLIRSTSAMNEWLAQVDDDLAEMKAPTVAQVLHTYRSGELCAVSGRTRTDPETAIALWGPLRQHSLALRGAQPAVDDLEAVLDEWIADELEFCSTRPDDDRALTIYAPVAMLNLPRVLVRRGFAPVSSTCIRHIRETDRAVAEELPDWICLRQVRESDRSAIAHQLKLIHESDVAAGCASPAATPRRCFRPMRMNFCHCQQGMPGWPKMSKLARCSAARRWAPSTLPGGQPAWCAQRQRPISDSWESTRHFAAAVSGLRCCRDFISRLPSFNLKRCCSIMRYRALSQHRFGIAADIVRWQPRGTAGRLRP